MHVPTLTYAQAITMTSDEIMIHSDEMETSSTRCPFNVIEVIRRYSGYISAFASTGIYACMTMTAWSLAGEIDSFTLTFVRGLISACLSVIVMSHQGTYIFITTMEEFKFHFVNAILTAAAMVCQVYAYHHMAAADAAAIICGYVAFTGVYGRAFLKESCGVLEVIMSILTFVGIVMIARPPFLFQFFENRIYETNSEEMLPSLVAFAATQALALTIVTLRTMGKQSIPVMKIMFYAMLGTMIVLAVPITLLGEWSIPNCSWGRFRMVISAVSGFLGYTCLTYALSVENAIHISLISLNDVLIVFFVSIIVFGFKPMLVSVMGMLLIMGSSIAVLLHKIIISRKEVEKQSLARESPTSLTDGHIVHATSV